MISLVLVFVSRLGSEITPQPELKETAKADMQQLMTLVRHTGVSITYVDKVSSVLFTQKKKKKSLVFLQKTNCV